MTDSNPEKLSDPLAESISLDTVFDLLSEERRRYVLYQLANAGRDVTTDELAERVVVSKTGLDSRDVSDAACGSVSSKLHHVDLPKLAQTGLIEYDPHSRVVRCPESIQPFDRWLDLSRQYDRPER